MRNPERARTAVLAADAGTIYDPIAGFYSTVFPLIWRYWFPRLHRWMADELYGAGEILDAGTGPGYWAHFVASTEERNRVVGIDLSRSFLARARRKPASAEVEFLRADMTDMPFASESFDAVVCSGVLDTLNHPEAALREFRRVLRPGGKVLLILRGGSPATSKPLETIFRWFIVGVGVIYRRSLSAATAFNGIWRRDAIWPRLPELATEAGLTLRTVNPGLLAGNVLLERTP
jgi:ubiquinone/menaquinone biosynthesis C-methylase UbiE